MSIEALVGLLRMPSLRAGAAAQLGEQLRVACDRLAAGQLPPERVGPVRAWRKKLESFECLAEADQWVELAHGRRLCAALMGLGQDAVRELVQPDGVNDPLRAPITLLPGIGPALGQRFAKRDLCTLEDLVWYVPRSYDDLRRVVPLGEVVAGARATFVGTVVRSRATGWRRRYVEVELGDGPVRIVARWFNVWRAMARRFVVGRRVVLSGIVRERNGELGVVNPELLGDPEDDATESRIALQPRYREVEGIASAVLRKAVRGALLRVAPHLADGIPESIRQRLDLCRLADALACLHEPPQDLGEDDVLALGCGDSVWHRRLAFDELFFLALEVARRRNARQRAVGPPCKAAQGAIPAIFPFTLTAAQRRAIAEISSDLAKSQPMNRLLQGEVGSGKTAVAFAAAAVAMAAGRQVAVMAPTELLAEQHVATLGAWAHACGYRAALLTASTSRAVRESTLMQVASGAVNLLVGTHALLAEQVGFSDLGLVIIDEQHRFGVAQRVRLRAGGCDSGRDMLPHLLVMTATPIPRSLALTIYGDLDVTSLHELPPGRIPPTTRVLSGLRGRKQAYRLLRQELESGARAFVVCPLVAPSDDSDGADATSTAARLAEELAPFRVGLVHGRVPASARDDAMARLRSGDLDVLVATTVIEVGVDVPAARVMLVEDADRFGLAQLHQLRGRVGRGSAAAGASHCLLLTRGTRTAEATRRLAVMEETSDGFRIAEEDLAIRGPGEILGVKQSGLPQLRFGDVVKHSELAALARQEAERLLALDPLLLQPEHAVTQMVLAKRTYIGAGTAEGG